MFYTKEGLNMFIYAMRAGTLRFFGIVCAALVALVTLIAFVPELQPAAATGGEGLTVALDFLPDWDEEATMHWLRQRRDGAADREAGSLLAGAVSALCLVGMKLVGKKMDKKAEKKP